MTDDRRFRDSDEEAREQRSGPRMLTFVILAMIVFYGGIAYLVWG